MLRDAEPLDVAALAALAATSYRVAFAEILEPAALALRDESFFSGYFTESLPQIRVALSGGTIAAFAKTTDDHLDMLFTDAAFQGSGHGDALLRDAEARGARSLEAFAANLPARAFYERRGWRLTKSYEREFIGKMRSFVFYEKSSQ